MTPKTPTWTPRPVYEETFPSLRAAAAALYNVTSANHALSFLLLSTPHLNPWTVIARPYFLTPPNRIKYATAAIHFSGTYLMLLTLALAFPPSLNLEPPLATPPPTV